MKQVLLIVLVSLFSIVLSVSTNCNASLGSNVLDYDYDLEFDQVLEVKMSPEECLDANLCVASCSQFNTVKDMVVMKVDLSDPRISSGLKDSYLGECMWDLTKNELEGKVQMDTPKSRGQYISQYIASLSAPFVSTLPKAPVKRVYVKVQKKQVK